VDDTCKRKPVGGFIFITVIQLCLVWWAYRQGLIRLKDLRVWFAAQELVARRCELKNGKKPHYSLKELDGLLGGRGWENESIRRLKRTGLLTWSDSTITFATSPEDLRVKDLEGFQEMLSRVTSTRRRIPVPRQIVRFIASPCKRCVIAAILGHLICCLFYQFHVKRCRSGGFCKASWIAETFRVDLRNVKAARKFLAEELGWLQPVSTPQRLLNRYGQRVIINLNWSRRAVDQAKEPATETPPPPPLSTTKTPPPEELNRKPLREQKHQEPAPGGKNPGVLTDGKEKKPPTLRHIIPEDLRDTERLLALFEEAQKVKVIGGSESERLTFIATAERARLVGTTNPCGLFAQLVRRRLWHFLTQEDEEAARKRLKEHVYGASPPRWPQAMRPGDLSDDARFAAVLQARLRQQGFDGEIFPLLHRERPEWTRERWERALSELEEGQRQRTLAGGPTSAADLAARVLSYGR
jgi:hypothetical protein